MVIALLQLSNVLMGYFFPGQAIVLCMILRASVAFAYDSRELHRLGSYNMPLYQQKL